MKNEIQGTLPSLPTKSVPLKPRSHRKVSPVSQSQSQPKTVLTPAQWVRAVLGVQTPFGHDHLPTVFE